MTFYWATLGPQTSVTMCLFIHGSKHNTVISDKFRMRFVPVQAPAIQKPLLRSLMVDRQSMPSWQHSPEPDGCLLLACCRQRNSRRENASRRHLLLLTSRCL